MHMLILYTDSRANIKIAERSDEEVLQKVVQNGSKTVPKWLQNGAWEPPDGVQNLILAPVASWRASWRALGTLLEASRALLGASWTLLRGSWRSLGRLWSAPKALRGPSWTLRGAF